MQPGAYKSEALQKAVDKRLRGITRTLRITAVFMFVMALAGGWNIFSLYGKYYTRNVSTDENGKFVVTLVREFDSKALWKGVPVAILMIAVGVTFLLLSWPARRGNGTAALTAGIMATVLVFVSAFFSLALLLYGIAMTIGADTWWEQALSIALVALCFMAVPWFIYVMIKGFESRRSRIRRGGFMVEPAPIRPVSSSDAPPEQT